MKVDQRRSIGRLGEILAADYLEKNGYKILAHNWRSPYGEIDLVSRRGEAIVFVEVKTRTSQSLGPPEISITHRKMQHLRETAACYIMEQSDETAAWQIDLITIQIRDGDDGPIIDHFENIVQ